MSFISNTAYKLLEAKFFLDKLQPQRPYFDFYLSAFLNASRSVTWIMRHEYNQSEEWNLWFENSEIVESEKSLLKEINELRIETTKRNGIKTEYFFLDHIVPDLESYEVIDRMQSDLEGDEVEITITEATSDKIEAEDGQYIIKGKVKMERENTQKSREELVELCERYYNFLDGKVEYCTRNFSEMN